MELDPKIVGALWALGGVIVGAALTHLGMWWFFK